MGTGNLPVRVPDDASDRRDGDVNHGAHHLCVRTAGRKQAATRIEPQRPEIGEVGIEGRSEPRSGNQRSVAAYRDAAAVSTPAGPVLPASKVAQLSPREQEILRGVARGASNKEIGRDLGIAETTVKIHVQHVLRKLDVSSRVQAAVIASEHGLV